MGAGISGAGHVGPTRSGPPPGGGRALRPCGQLVRPLGVFFAPEILKYYIKNHTEFQCISRTSIFGTFFIAWIIQKTDRKYYFRFI